MQRKLGVVALLFFFFVSADAKPVATFVADDPPACGICFEQDNETLPDRHYFPAKSEIEQHPSQFLPSPHEDASGIAEQIWVSGATHADYDARANRESSYSHGSGNASASVDASDMSDDSWTWGGMRECARGPEGKIAAGCHIKPYDNLLCNSHYDDCDDELFALAITAVQDANATTLRHLLRHDGRISVTLNQARGAIQLVGCRGDIVGNLPIEPSLLRTLR